MDMYRPTCTCTLYISHQLHVEATGHKTRPTITCLHTNLGAHECIAPIESMLYQQTLGKHKFFKFYVMSIYSTEGHVCTLHFERCTHPTSNFFLGPDALKFIVKIEFFTHLLYWCIFYAGFLVIFSSHGQCLFRRSFLNLHSH